MEMQTRQLKYLSMKGIQNRHELQMTPEKHKRMFLRLRILKSSLKYNSC